VLVSSGILQCCSSPFKTLQMKPYPILAGTLFSLVVLSASCHKSDDNAVCIAGTGGNTELVVFARHNGNTIIHSFQQPDTAFLTWTDPPVGPDYYDKAYAAEPGEDHIHIPNLKCGSYTVRLSVYDTVAGKRYSGRMSLAFTKTSGEVDTAIDVN
jgi:hypothetical protein